MSDQQTVSHMKADILKFKIWYLIEVAEVEIAASGGRQSGQGPDKKEFDQKFWNQQFLSYKSVIHLKRKLRTIVIQIWNKIREFLADKIEKSWFRDFRSQKFKMSRRSRLNF